MNPQVTAIILILTAWIPVQAAPQTNDLGSPQALAFYFENDLFVGTDRCYTGGYQLSWISKALSDTMQNPWVKWMPFTRGPGYQNALSFSLGQNLYTPDDLVSSEVIPDDRPYAGHLYLSFGIHSRSQDRKDLWELSLGMVGPAAHGEQAQEFIHRVIEGVEPRGWQNQLHNEFVIGLVFERKWKALRWGKAKGFGMEFIPHIGVGAGNLYVYASAGTQMRFGWNLPHDFGTKLIRPGGSRSTDIREKGPFGIYAYAAIDGKGIARNIFLDGNTFGESHHVQKNPWTVELILGLSMRLGRFNVGYEKVFWSKKFKTESRKQAFGALNLTYSF